MLNKEISILKNVVKNKNNIENELRCELEKKGSKIDDLSCRNAKLERNVKKLNYLMMKGMLYKDKRTLLESMK